MFENLVKYNKAKKLKKVESCRNTNQTFRHHTLTSVLRVSLHEISYRAHIDWDRHISRENI